MFKLYSTDTPPAEFNVHVRDTEFPRVGIGSVEFVVCTSGYAVMTRGVDPGVVPRNSSQDRLNTIYYPLTGTTSVHTHT